MLNSPAFIRLRRRFAETGLISARQERLPPSSRVAGLWWARNAKVYEKTQKPDSNVLTAPRLLQLLAFRLQPWLRQAFVSTVLPLLQTNSGRPKRLFSARTFRATRCKDVYKRQFPYLSSCRCFAPRVRPPAISTSAPPDRPAP